MWRAGRARAGAVRPPGHPRAECAHPTRATCGQAARNAETRLHAHPAEAPHPAAEPPTARGRRTDRLPAAAGPPRRPRPATSHPVRASPGAAALVGPSIARRSLGPEATPPRRTCPGRRGACACRPPPAGSGAVLYAYCRVRRGMPAGVRQPPVELGRLALFGAGRRGVEARGGVHGLRMHRWRGGGALARQAPEAAPLGQAGGRPIFPAPRARRHGPRDQAAAAQPNPADRQAPARQCASADGRRRPRRSRPSPGAGRAPVAPSTHQAGPTAIYPRPCPAP